MRHRHPITIPEHQRARVVLIDDDPHHEDRVVVVDTGRNRATMSVAAFWATCRLAPGAKVNSVRLWPAE
jgi:hypothetical protein